MKRFLQAAVIWTIVWALLLVAAYLLSDGEPICKGPLVLGVEDSDPPQCDDPSAALPTVGLMIFAVGFFPSMVVAAAVSAFDARISTCPFQRADRRVRAQRGG